MNKEKALHWIYPLIISMITVLICGLIYMKTGVKIANNYTDEAIKKYDSVVTKKNEAQYDTIINGIKDLKKQINESDH